MIGYDFNGVVDLGRPGLRPTIDDCIITGNTYVPEVLNYLDREGLRCAVYFMPKTEITKDHRYAAAVWKSEMVRRLRLDKFYESDQRTCEIIAASCPDCEVIKVN